MNDGKRLDILPLLYLVLSEADELELSMILRIKYHTQILL